MGVPSKHEHGKPAAYDDCADIDAARVAAWGVRYFYVARGVLP